LVPRSHFAVGLSSALWFSLPDGGESRSRDSTDPLFEFRLPPEFFPVAPSRPHCRDSGTDSSRGLLLPSAHARLGGPLDAGLPRPLRFTSRVWLPVWRFTPPAPGPALFHADGAPGIRPFGAFPSRKVSWALPPAMNPPAVSLAVAPSDESSDRPDKFRLLGFDPFESPLPPPTRLTWQRLDAPLGFCLSRAFHRAPCRRPTPAPLTRLTQCSSANCNRAGTSKSQSVPDWLDLARTDQPRDSGPAALLRFLHRFAPAAQNAGDPGYAFTSRAGRHY
jgi:hypothetical protein